MRSAQQCWKVLPAVQPKVNDLQLEAAHPVSSRLTLLVLDAQGLLGMCMRFAMLCAAPDVQANTPQERRKTLNHCIQTWAQLCQAKVHYLADFDPALTKLMEGALSRSNLETFDRFVAMGEDICDVGQSTQDHVIGELVQFVAQELTDALTGVFSTARMVAEMGSGHVAQLALTDELTGLPNRRALQEMLHRTQAAGWPQGQIAIMKIDLDRFKSVNDSFGHAAGDVALQHAAKAMTAHLCKGDFLARIGGDEFVVVCFGQPAEEVLATVSERMIAGISEPFIYKGKTCYMGASVGIASSCNPADMSFDQFLHNADLALYNAKNAGRGVYRFFSPSLRTQYEEVEELHRQIREGLENNQFVPFFQPQVEGRSGKVVGFEALARWCHPTRGVLLPHQFLSAASDAGLLERLDRDLMTLILGEVAGWKSAGMTIPQVSMNLTATRLIEVDLVDTMLAAVNAVQIAPQDIGLEILESAMIENTSRQIIDNIQNLSAAGFKVELDDFGTGHASISNLRNFKVDRIKIDRSFVKDVHLFSELSKITSAMIGLAHSLRVDALAEGVETPEERLVLNALGVDHIQGYGVARPMRAADVPRWLGGTQQDWVLPPRKNKAPSS